jgi:hypothetical protein
MLKGLSVLGAVAQFSNFVSATKEAVDDAQAIKDMLLTYNSQKDVEFQAKNPPPAASAPDIEQIFYYSERAVSLSVELVGELGRFAEGRLKHKNS